MKRDALYKRACGFREIVKKVMTEMIHPKIKRPALANVHSTRPIIIISKGAGGVA